MTIDTAKERERLERLNLDCLNCGLPDTACDCDDPLHEAPEVPADRYLTALDVIDAQAAEIKRLEKRVFDQENRLWELGRALDEYRQKVNVRFTLPEDET